MYISQLQVIFHQAGTAFGMLPTVESAHVRRRPLLKMLVLIFTFFSEREKKKKDDFNVPP